MHRRLGWARRNGLAPLLALALATACQGPPPGPGPAEQVQVGPGRITVAGRTFKFRTADGRPLGGLSAVIGGKRVGLGQALPADLARQANANGLVLLADGFVPVRLSPGKGDVELVLVPTKPAPPGVLAVEVPPAMVGGGAAPAIAAATYAPAGMGDLDARMKQEAAAVAGDALSFGGRPGTTGGPPACDDPLPCPPPAHALGVLITVDAPLAPGELTLAPDLDALAAASPEHAAAVARIRKTYADIALRPDAPRWHQALGERHGLGYVGGKFTVRLQVAPSDFTDGVARIAVIGSALLGVYLEVTLVSAARDALPTLPANPAGATPGPTPTAVTTPTGLTPPAVAIPAVGCAASLPTGLLPGPGEDLEAWYEAHPNLITDNGGGVMAGSDGSGSLGGNILSNNGGNVVGNHGANVISDQGGSIVSNNGGGFTGPVYLPEPPLGAKYALLDFEDIAWPRLVDVRAVTADLHASDWATNDDASEFRVTNVPRSHSLLYLQGKAVAPDGGPYTLWALAPTPGCDVLPTRLDAATTAVTALAQDEIRTNRGSIEDLDYAGYAADVQFMRKALDPPTARRVLRLAASDPPAGAALARSLMKSKGYTSKLVPAATAATFAGGVPASYLDGNGLAARFDSPTDLAVEGGVLYVCDRDNDAIRAIDLAEPGRPVRTVVRAPATFARPRGIDVAGGFLYVADGDNQLIRRIRISDGQITAVAGSGTRGATDGPAAAARFARPLDVARDAAGNLYVADADNNAIRKITPAGTVSTIAGGGAAGFEDGARGRSKLSFPYGLAIGKDGGLYVADCGNHAVRRVDLADPAHPTTTVIGRGVPGFANGGRGLALLTAPSGIAADGQGNLYVSEYNGRRIRKIVGVTGEARALTLVGGGDAYGYVDGEGLAAVFNRPRGLAVAGDGRVFVADRDNERIRVITPP